VCPPLLVLAAVAEAEPQVLSQRPALEAIYFLLLAFQSSAWTLLVSCYHFPRRSPTRQPLCLPL
jgi:hypothetical protein